MKEDTPDAAPLDTSPPHIPELDKKDIFDTSEEGTSEEVTGDAFDYGTHTPQGAPNDLGSRPEPVSSRIGSYPNRRIRDLWRTKRVRGLESEKRSKSGSEKRFTLLIAATLISGVLGAAITAGALISTGVLTESDSTVQTTIATAEAPVDVVTETRIINNSGAAVNPAAVAAKALPSVVTISVYDSGSEQGVGSGSGVVITVDGYIITNHHVILGADLFSVMFEDGREYEAILIGSDSLTDLAVLQISASSLIPAKFGDSESLHVGDPAIAIGNPLGQEGGSSVTAGIISAFDRRVDFSDGAYLHGMIQTDAAINSGSSGGALFDAEGRLIGITSAIGVSVAGPEGIGYAIPIELVNRITAEIIETGDVAHPFLGVMVATNLKETADGAIVPSGAVIDTIEGTDSAAGMAGLRPGDVVIEIGGKTITDQTDLILAVRLHRVGDEVEFVVIRLGETLSFDVTMGQRPSEYGG